MNWLKQKPFILGATLIISALILAIGLQVKPEGSAIENKGQCEVQTQEPVASQDMTVKGKSQEVSKSSSDAWGLDLNPHEEELMREVQDSLDYPFGTALTEDDPDSSEPCETTVAEVKDIGELASRLKDFFASTRNRDFSSSEAATLKKIVITCPEGLVANMADKINGVFGDDANLDSDAFMAKHMMNMYANIDTTEISVTHQVVIPQQLKQR